MLSDRRLSSRSRTRKRGKTHLTTNISTDFEHFVEKVRPEIVSRLKVLGFEGRKLVAERNRLISEMYNRRK